MPLQRLVSADAMAALGPRAALPGPRRAVRRGGGGARQRAARHPAAHGAARRRGAGRGGPRRAGHAVDGPAALRRRGGRRRAGPRRRRRRSLHEARPLLHPGAGRRDPGLRHARRRHLACTGWTAPTPATCTGASERIVDVAWSVSPGSVFLVAIQAEALDRHRLLSRHHQGARRREGQHPVGVGGDVEGPGGDLAVQLRDGRPEAPGPRAARPCATSRASTTCTG